MVPSSVDLDFLWILIFSQVLTLIPRSYFLSAMVDDGFETIKPLLDL